MSSQKKAIVKDVGRYSGATVLTQVITLVAAIFVRRFLGPLQTGVWSLLQVILSYAPYAALGTPEAVTREIPFYRGKGDEEKIEEIKNTVVSFAITVSCIIALMAIVFAFMKRATLMPELFYGLLITAGLVILQRANNLLITLLRAFKEFTLASKQMIYSALVNVVLMLGLSYPFKFYGFMTAMALSFVFNIVYILWHQPFQIQWGWTWGRVKPLILYGLPLMALGFMNILFMSVDKIMTARWLGLEALGLYSIAVLAYQYLNKIPSSIGVVLVPHFHEKFGEREKIEDLRHYVENSADVFTTIMPIVIVAVWFFVKPGLELLLPEFLMSLEAIQLLMIGAFFLSVEQPYSTFIVAIKKHMILIPLMVVTTLFAIVMNGVAIYRGWGVTGIALATALALALRFFMIYAYASMQLYQKLSLNTVGIYLSKLIFLGVLIWLSERLYGGVTNLWWRGSLSLVTSLLCFAPMIFTMLHKYKRVS